MGFIMANYSTTKRTAIGTELDDYIYAQEYYTSLSGKNEGKGFTIKGGDGNDTYIQNSYQLERTNIIYDVSGDSDSFTFKYGSSSDMDVLVNVYADGTYDSDLTLTSNYYANNKIIFKEYFNEGKIENIYQDSYKISETQLKACIQEVAKWLSDNGFESAQEVLDSGNETNINILYTKFDNCWTY